MKKIISILAALVLLVSMCSVTAFATSTTDETQQTVIADSTHDTQLQENKSTLKEYSITYYGIEGADNKNNPVSYTNETGFIVVPPTKEGFTFKGWTGTVKTTMNPAMRVIVNPNMPAGYELGNAQFTATWEKMKLLQ